MNPSTSEYSEYSKTSFLGHLTLKVLFYETDSALLREVLVYTPHSKFGYYLIICILYTIINEKK